MSVLGSVLELGALLHTLQHLVAPFSPALALSCLFLGRIFLLFFWSWFYFSLTSSPEALQAPLRFTEATGLTIATHTGLLAATPACGIQHLSLEALQLPLSFLSCPCVIVHIGLLRYPIPHPGVLRNY